MRKIHITEEQLKNIVELVTKTRVICDKCEWSWKLSDGGDDPYICHKCGHNNEEKLKK
jgi:tRNA(Ile2) C34 agmatinyltransferase TiaS